MKFSVSIYGEKLVSTKFERAARAAMNVKPAFDNVANELMRITETQFESQGRRGGGSWKGLDKKWLFRKTKAGHDPRILHMRGALRRSVTKRKAKGQILIITPDSLTFGTSLPYAARHQFGVPGETPKRPFLRTTKHDRENMRDEIRDHLMKSWSMGGGKN